MIFFLTAHPADGITGWIKWVLQLPVIVHARNFINYFGPFGPVDIKLIRIDLDIDLYVGQAPATRNRKFLIIRNVLRNGIGLITFSQLVNALPRSIDDRRGDDNVFYLLHQCYLTAMVNLSLVRHFNEDWQ